MPTPLREELEKRMREENAPDADDKQSKTPDQRRGKEDNLAALRRAKEEQEEQLRSLQGENESLKSKAAKLEDERFKKLLETLENDYEDDPEKLLTEVTTLKTSSGEWETKLREKDEILERVAFEQSEPYKKHVKEPIASGEQTLKGVIKKDEALYKQILKSFVYDRDNNVIANPSLTADEIIALDELLEEHDEIKPERVKLAIENLREKFHGANDYYKNFKTRIQEEETARQAQLAEKNAQEAGVAKLARAQAIKRGASILLQNEKLRGVVDEDFLSALPKTVLTSVENAISNRVAPSLEEMAQNQMKALLFDNIVANGGLELLRQAIDIQSDHSKGSDGTRGSGKPGEKKITGSIRDILAEKAGMSRRLS